MASSLLARYLKSTEFKGKDRPCVPTTQKTTPQVIPRPSTHHHRPNFALDTTTALKPVARMNPSRWANRFALRAATPSRGSR